MPPRTVKLILQGHNDAATLNAAAAPKTESKHPKPAVVSGRVAKHPKKAQVTIACGCCRQSKAKCTGARPVCARCLKSDLVCTYSGNVGETREGALKRQLAEANEKIRLLESGPGAKMERMWPYFKSLTSTDHSITVMLATSFEDFVEMIEAAKALKEVM
ncbi:hypothetical protein BU16DRAFT_532100 [Lophium mytilinum]|uniref:Zn(2)-C6 fungal-type domain-containing protein n=1 Tax=Lophium mytilinum TaxID=390894 RepID=A0A6A6Q880_9PEZI|nr:hypothetical protein BU16DRAFT_532100 [Lophium mytilinum]